MKYGAIILSGVLLLFWSCANRALEDESAKIVFTPLEETVEIHDMSDYVADISFVQIADDDRLMISGISKTILDSEGNLHVLDYQGNIVSIGKDCSCLGNIANKGRAGNEYINASDIALVGWEHFGLGQPVCEEFQLIDT